MYHISRKTWEIDCIRCCSGFELIEKCSGGLNKPGRLGFTGSHQASKGELLIHTPKVGILTESYLYLKFHSNIGYNSISY